MSDEYDAEEKPLAGRTILVAGSEDRTPKLGQALKRQGARVVSFPTVRIAPPKDYGPLDAALAEWGSFDWIVFTSAHGVESVVRRAHELHVNLRGTRGRIAAVGPVTRAALERNGLPVDAVPREYVTDAIAKTMGDVAGKRILLPRSRISRQSLPDALQAAGAQVVQVDAYDAVPAEATDGDSLETVFDFVVFMSASSAENLAILMSPERFAKLVARTPAAVIGPVTAEAARILGFHVTVVSPEHTIEGLVESLAKVNPHE